jgi:hypothetical protein
MARKSTTRRKEQSWRKELRSNRKEMEGRLLSKDLLG